MQVFKGIAKRELNKSKKMKHDANCERAYKTTTFKMTFQNTTRKDIL